MCSASKMSEERLNEQLDFLRTNFYGVSEQFMDDVKTLAYQYQNKMNDLVGGIFGGLVSGIFRFDIKIVW